MPGFPLGRRRREVTVGAPDTQPVHLSAVYETLIRTIVQDPAVIVMRIYPPRDIGGEAEVLFLSGPDENDDREACTAYIQDLGPGVAPEILIASGW